MYTFENPLLKIDYQKIEEIKSLYPNVEIIAATKYIMAHTMIDLCSVGINNFGENRVDSFVKKHFELRDLDIKWHFIGHLQRNKAKLIINDIDCLHSLDSLELAKIIDEKRDRPLDCYIELKLTNNPLKNVVKKDNLESFINEVKDKYKKVNIIGLMAMTDENMSDDNKLKLFKEVKEIGEKYNLHKFSMGMSEDYNLAIEAGSTTIRLGRILYKED